MGTMVQSCPSELIIECMVRFRQTCKRYNIDFATADPDEKEFVMRMAEKLALRRA